MEINQSILLNLSGEPQCINLPAKQGDIHTRYLTCSFQMNQTPYVIPASATARVCFHKPDDLCVVQDAEIRDNTVILELTQQMLAVPGTAQCEIMFYLDDMLLTSSVFTVQIFPSSYDGDAIESSAEYQSFQTALLELEDAMDRLDHILEVDPDQLTRPVPIEKGGTGAANCADALTALGAAATQHTHNAGDITTGILPIAQGGTGSATASAALDALGIPALIQYPNLLINGNLVNAVNQRNQTSFSAANQYTVDRWMLESGSAAYSAGTGLTLSNATVCQFVEGLSAFQGQVFTLSASIGGTVQTVTGTLGSAAVTQGALSFVYTSTGWCKISISGSGTLMWAKLELGSYATPLYPKLPGEELPLCQRYYTSIYKEAHVNVGQGRTGASHNPWIYLYFPVIMRTAPEVTVYSDAGNENKLTVTGGIEITPNSVWAEPNGARIDGGNNMVDIGANVFCYYTADAEIYS